MNIDLSDIDFGKLSVSKSDIKNWIDKNQDLLETQDIRDIWFDLEVNTISTVENPAHPSEIVSMKSEDDEDGYTVESPVLKSDSDEKIFQAPAMVADRPDREGDIVPYPVVEQAAHDFLSEKRVDDIDADHETPISMDSSATERGRVVESWILSEDKEFETVHKDKNVEYQQGDWMVKIQVDDDEIWSRIKSGELEGLSIMGKPVSYDVSNQKDIQTDEQEDDMIDKDELLTEISELLDEKIEEMYADDDDDDEDDEDEKDIPVDILSGAQLLYESEERAEMVAEFMGLSGTHTHQLDGETLFMPATSHSEYEEALDMLEADDEETEEPENTEEDEEVATKPEEIEECVESVMEENPELSKSDAFAICNAEIDTEKEVPDKYLQEADESQFIPSDESADSAEQAIEWHQEHDEEIDAFGDDGEGLRRAAQIVRHKEEGETLDIDYWQEIDNFHSRHHAQGNEELAEEFEDEPWKDNGYISHLAWGGDSAFEQAEEVMDVVEQVDESEEENLDDPEFGEGDAVMWSSNDTPVHGRVNDIHEQYSPAEGVTITGDEGEAVYSIFEYDDSLETPVFRDTPSNPNIAKPQSSLSESTKDMPDLSEENFESDREEESNEEESEEKEIDRKVDENANIESYDNSGKFDGLLDY